MTSTTDDHDTPAITSAISWVATTEQAAWQLRPTPEFVALTGMPDIMIDTTVRAQTVEGFGAAFNELGWTALEHLTDEERDGILAELFEPGRGTNLTVCRMPVGANDFSRDWYSYDEVAGDTALEHFSIENDLDTLVPFIRAATTHQPELRLWASPWSPPTWLKTNGHYAGSLPIAAFSGVENGLRPDQVGHEGTDMFRVDDEGALRTYADYFGRFIDAYGELGIRIGMVMPQNEWNSAQVFPSCTWTPDGLAAFIRHLGPAMRSRGVEIFLGTLERADDSLVTRVLDDPDARRAVSGVGLQWHGKGAAPFVHHDHPELRIYQTEQECGDGRNDWRYCRYSWTQMKGYFDNGANAYTYWNMALLDGGISRWGWAQNSLVVVDPETRTFRYTHEYHVLKHVSHFVEVGAQVVPSKSFTGFENQLVFRNPDGSVVIVMQNDLATEVRPTILIDGRVFSPLLPADSFNTFVLPAQGVVADAARA